jgi:predicted DNA-binding transcriptional regulator AlpA
MANGQKVLGRLTLTELLGDLTRISALPREEIAELRGQIAKLDKLLLSRLLAGEPVQSGPDADRLLTATEAAQKLGATLDWVYRNAHALPFAVRVGKRHVRFSEAGMCRYIQQRMGR